PFLTRNLVPWRWANFMMGLALFWIMQFHLSWVVLIPFIALSFYFQFRDAGHKPLAPLIWFAGGAVITGGFLIPTLITYGLRQGVGDTNEAIQFSFNNLLRQWNIVE